MDEYQAFFRVAATYIMATQVPIGHIPQEANKQTHHIGLTDDCKPLKTAPADAILYNEL